MAKKEQAENSDSIKYKLKRKVIDMVTDSWSIW